MINILIEYCYMYVYLLYIKGYHTQQGHEMDPKCCLICDSRDFKIEETGIGQNGRCLTNL